MDTDMPLSDLYYAVQNEDYRTERAVLARVFRGAPLRVLLIASSGETALSLLADERVGAVHAVDLLPTQLHLCDLRRTAVEQLGRDEQLRLLGAAEASGEERLRLYDRLRPRLHEAVRDYWDARRDEIAIGIQALGRNDVMMRHLRERLRAAGFDPLGRRLKDGDLPGWRAVYADLMTPAYVQRMFGLASGALAERIAGIAQHLGECHFHALRRPGAARDPFVTTVFAGRYALDAGDEGLPLYLQAGGQAALRRMGVRERLWLHQGNIVERIEGLAANHGGFDLISISNIADWMTDEQFAGVLLRVRAALRPGGAFLARTATGGQMIVELTAQHMCSDGELAARLPQIERGPWFRTIALGFGA